MDNRVDVLINGAQRTGAVESGADDQISGRRTMPFMSIDARADVPATPARRRMSRGVYVAAAAITAVLVLAAGWLAYNAIFADPSSQAIRACEQYILHSSVVYVPTAKFSDEQFINTDHPEVTGEVDVLNSVGLAPPHPFTCTMAKQNGDWIAIYSTVS